MTVSNETNRNSYTATASQTLFAYTFRVLNQEHLAVYQNDVLLTLTTHYTVSGVGDSSGGNITLVTGATANDSIVILRNVPKTQLVDYVENDPFPAQTHEDALDQITMSVQELDEKIDRAIILDPSSTLTGVTFPDAVPGNHIVWNSAGTGFENISALGTAGAVFNELGAAVDFRIESDSEANAFVIDGTLNTLSIGLPTTINDPLTVTGLSTLGALNVVGAVDVRGSTVFNENAQAVDFRVESSNNPTMFQVDASADIVSVGNVLGTQGALSVNKTNMTSTLQDVGLHVAFEQSGGGHASTGIPTGILVEGSVTSGVFSHAIGVFGWFKNLTDVQNLPIYYGVEGRVDMDITGSVASSNTPIATGVLGIANIDASDNTNTACIGVEGRAGLGDNGTGTTGTLVGGKFYADGNGAVNYNAQFGLGDSSGDNYATQFIGYIGDASGGIAGEILVDDTNDEFLIRAIDSHLDSIGVQLRDNAGASKFVVRDSGGTEVFGIDSDGQHTTTRVEVGNFTRSGSASSGTQSVAVAFRPTSVEIMMSDDTSFIESSHGFSDGTNHHCVVSNGGVNYRDNSNTIIFDDGTLGTATQKATITLTDSGFDVVWTKAGSPAGDTLNMVYIARR